MNRPRHISDILPDVLKGILERNTEAETPEAATVEPDGFPEISREMTHE